MLIYRPSSCTMAEGRTWCAWDLELSGHGHHTLQWSPFLDPDRLRLNAVFNLAAANPTRHSSCDSAIWVCFFNVPQWRSWLVMILCSVVNNSDDSRMNRASSSIRTMHTSHLEMVLMRSHRSIKWITTQKNCTIMEAMYWYNIISRDDVSTSSMPTNLLHSYRIRVKGIDAAPPPSQITSTRLKVGDTVWITNPHRWCTTKFVKGRITRITSPQLVDVDGIPWHVEDMHSWFSSLPPADDGGNPTLKRNNWQEPSFGISSSNTLSESDEEVGLVNIEPPPPTDHDSNFSAFDDLAKWHTVLQLKLINWESVFEQFVFYTSDISEKVKRSLVHTLRRYLEVVQLFM